MPAHVTTRALSDAVWARLSTVPNLPAYAGTQPYLTAYRGLVAAAPPVVPGSAAVLPYLVLYSGAGRDVPIVLDESQRSLSWSFQVTVAGGFVTHVEYAVDAVRAALSPRWTIAGLYVSSLVEVFDPGAMRVDQETSPDRFYLPLFYRLPATLAYTP